MKKAILLLPVLLIGCATVKPITYSVQQYQAKEQLAEHNKHLFDQCVVLKDELQTINDGLTKKVEVLVEDRDKLLKAIADYLSNPKCRCIHRDILRKALGEKRYKALSK